MDELSLSGMFLDEAEEALRENGITEYEVVVTGPPKLSDRTADSGSRVLLADFSRTPVKILVCKPE